MRTVAEHQRAIRDLLSPLTERAIEDVPVGPELLDRVLASDIRSPIDLPPFDNSQMDGYAVRVQDTVGAPMPVAPRIAAGARIGVLDAGTAAPIMTGAPIPEGADAVVPIEQAVPARFLPEDAAHEVLLPGGIEAGTFVRRRGSDLSANGLLLEAGTRLGPAQCGVIAASGIVSVAVRRRVRVLVISSGDEVRQPGERLEPGQIYDANRTAMAVALSAAGAVPVLGPTVTDEPAGLREVLAASAASVDLVLTTGGVSAGAYEVVRDVLEPVGVRFGSVAMQPGGPQGWGMAALTDAVGVGIEVPVIAFPGNPVSALVSFEVFLRPVLDELAGRAPRAADRAALAVALESPEGKHQVRRGRWDEHGRIELVGGPSSHLLHGYASSTLLIHIPLGVSSLDEGDLVEIWRIDD